MNASAGRSNFSGNLLLRWLPKYMPGNEPINRYPNKVKSTEPR